MSNLTIKNLRKSYGDVHVLNGINLEIKDHEFVVFVGPSGCGKSTLLRSIVGLETVNEGQFFLDDKEITNLPPSKRDLAMVFQSYALYPHMSVQKNMSFALELAREDKNIIEKKVNNAAKILQIEALLDRKPRDLSGGQRQRVAIGRAIVRNPKIFLFDEPLSNLDASLRVQMRLELSRLHKNLHATMIYVTHDQIEAMTLADKVVILNQGRIEQIGSPMELYSNPANQFVAGFLGMPKMSFLPAKVIEDGDTGLKIKLSSGSQIQLPIDGKSVSAGGKVTLGIRPENVNITDKRRGHVSANFDVTEQLGSDTFHYVKTEANESITVRADRNSNSHYSETIGLDFDLNQCHVFNENGKALDKLAL